MEMQDLIARIEKLEAETNVLRRYTGAVNSLLPNAPPINAVFNEVHRQVNLDSIRRMDQLKIIFKKQMRLWASLKCLGWVA